MRSAIVGLMLLGLPAIANAGDYDSCTTPHHDYGGGMVSVLVGTNTGFDHTTWSSRLTLQIAGDMARGKHAALGFVLPPTWMSTGPDHVFGVGHTNVIEAPPSLRLRMLTDWPIRPYLDAGIGAVFVTTNDRSESGLFRNRTQNTGWMTRAAFGLEMGAKRGPLVLLQPVEWDVYDLGPKYSRWGAEIGIGGRF